MLPVDIMLLTLDSYDIFEQCVKRIIRYTPQNQYNLHVFDNGSNSANKVKIESLQNILKFSLHRSEENLGIVSGRNVAVKTFLSSNRFVILDDDQFVSEGWLSTLQSKMDTGFDIVGHEAWKMIPPPNSREYFPFKKCTNQQETYNYVGCGGQLISRKVYDQIGLYDEQFNPAYFEDPDFCFRAIQSGFRISWQPCAIDHVGHQGMNKQKLFNRSSQFQKSWSNFREKWHPYFQEISNAECRRV